MFNKKYLTSIGLTAGLTLSTLVSASRVQASSFFIDKFYDNNIEGIQSIGIPTDDETSDSSQSDFDSGILGGYRDMALTNYAVLDENGGSGVSAEAVEGDLAWNNDTGAVSNFTATWDGNDDPGSINTMGLGGVDITNNLLLEGILVEIVEADETSREYGYVALDIYDMSGNLYSISKAVSELIAFDNKEGLFFDFNDFESSTNPTVTRIIFQNVGAIQMKLYGEEREGFQGGIDFSVSLLEVTTNPNNPPKTPEPSLSLLALAAFGTIGIKLKKK